MALAEGSSRTTLLAFLNGKDGRDNSNVSYRTADMMQQARDTGEIDIERIHTTRLWPLFSVAYKAKLLK